MATERKTSGLLSAPVLTPALAGGAARNHPVPADNLSDVPARRWHTGQHPTSQGSPFTHFPGQEATEISVTAAPETRHAGKA